MEQLLVNFTGTSQILTYMGVFIGMFIEGEIILILAGILIKSGAIGFFNTLWIAFIAVILHDMAYWYIGKKLNQLNKKRYLIFNLEKIEPLFNRFEKHKEIYVFISKFAWNMNRLVLVSLGYLKIPYKNIFKVSVVASFAWTLTFVSLGYIFAEQTDILKKDLKIVAILVMVLFIGIVWAENLIEKYFKIKGINGGDNGDKKENRQSSEVEK